MIARHRHAWTALLAAAVLLWSAGAAATAQAAGGSGAEAGGALVEHDHSSHDHGALDQPLSVETACARGLEATTLDDGEIICTHGADHPEQFPASAPTTAHNGEPGTGIACFGNGSSGRRV